MTATITYQGAGTAAANTTAATSISVAYPSSPQANDVIVLVVGHANSTVPGTSAATGFTRQVSSNAGGSSPSFAMYTRVADGTESGSLSVTTQNNTSQARMFLYRSSDPTTPIDVTGTTFSSSTGVTAYDIPTLTTTRAGVALVTAGVGNSAAGTWTPPTNPAQFTEVWDSLTTTPVITTDYLIWSGSGATGTVNLVKSASVRGAAGMIALRPAASQLAASGQVDAVSAVTGEAALGRPASGQVDAVTDASGSINNLLRPVDAQVDVVSDAVGAANYIVAASGTAAATSGVTGEAGLLTPASGTVAAVSDAFGSASPQFAASGQVDGTTGATGSATVLAAATGTTTATTGVSGGVALLARASGTAAAVTGVSGAATALKTAGASATNSYVEVYGSATLLTEAGCGVIEVVSGVSGYAGIALDITVAAVLDARTWSAELDERTWEASL
jgi:hypothetical protein